MSQRILSDTPTHLVDPAVEPSRFTAWFMTVGGAIALFAAATLTIDKIKYWEAVARKESTTLGCDINAFVSCGGVINTEQASAFGFPNPIIGVVSFSVVIAFGVLFLARVQVPRWIWSGLLAGSTFGICFITWLQYSSIYVIGKLCPWCMVVWTVMIPLFVLIATQTLRVYRPGASFTRFVNEWKLLIVLLWYVAVMSTIWFQFGARLWA